MKQHLQESWKKRCSVYSHSDQEPIKGSRHHFQPKICHKLGVCVCGIPAGSCPNALRVFTNAEPFLRRIFAQKQKTKTEARKLLDDCKIFLKVSPFHHGVEEGQHLKQLPPNLWAYVGYVNRSTWHFSILRMFECDSGLAMLELHEQTSSDQIVMLSIPDARNLNECLLTDIEFFKQCLDFRFAYKLSIFSLIEEEAAWDPSDCSCQSIPVCPCSHAEEFVVWRPEDGQRGQKRPARDRSEKEALTEDQLIQMLENPRCPKQRKQSSAKPAAQDAYQELGHDSNSSHDSDSDDGAGGLEREEPQDRDDDVDSELDGFVPPSNPGTISYSPTELGSETDRVEAALDLDADLELLAKSSAIDAEMPDANCKPSDTMGAKLQKFLEQAPPAAAAGDIPVPEQAEQAASASSPRPASSKPKPRDRISAESLSIPGCGVIRYLPATSVLIAACDHPGHGDCRRQKTVSASNTNTPKGQGQGRPLGFLVAWLREQCNHDDRAKHVRFNPSLAQRQNARQWLFSHDLAGAEASEFSQQFERARRAGEEEEPTQI